MSDEDEKVLRLVPKATDAFEDFTKKVDAVFHDTVTVNRVVVLVARDDGQFIILAHPGDGPGLLGMIQIAQSRVLRNV